MIKDAFKKVLDIHKDERRFAFLMASYFFLAITAFWILKPLKKAAFLGFYSDSPLSFLGMNFSAADAELLAKVANMGIAMIAVILFTLLSKKYSRHQLTLIFALFFACCFLFIGLFISPISPTIAWSLYLVGDLYSTLMIATFFIFLNDSVNTETAKRLYGLIGLGGVLGGAFGSITVRTFVKSEQVTPSDWMWLSIVITLVIAVIAYFANKAAPIQMGAIKGSPLNHLSTNQASTASTNPVLEGAKLVFQSKYLFAIASIVALYEITSTLVDYQFTRTLLHFVAKEDLRAAFGTAYVYLNITAVIVQLFFTSYMMRRFGLKIALFVLPLVILLVSTGFMITPVLALAMLMPSADGGIYYSLNQSAKEVLYVPTSRDEKYKAKAFIDMFVQRFSKVIAIGMTLIITAHFQDFESVRWLSLLTIITIILWLIAVRYVGNEFKRKIGYKE